jgi:hypothetical protein
MNTEPFERWVRDLAAARSRRGAVVGLIVGTLSLSGRADTEAKHHTKKHKKHHGGGSPPVAAPAEPTCTDGLQNGSETGVDCGGSCPPCANGQGCTSRHDCASAVCTAGICQTCAPGSNCSVGESCICVGPESGVASPVCVTSGAGPTEGGCTACPAGTICTDFGTPGTVFCNTPCAIP